MNNKQLRIFELILVISIAFLPSIIKSIFYIFSGQEVNYSQLQYSDYIVWLFQAMLSIILMFYILYKNKKNYTDIGIKLKFEWRDIIIGIGLMIIAGFTNSILAGLINSISPELVEKANSPQNFGFLETNNWGILFLVMIIIPIEEELIVRGFTMTEVYKLTENKVFAVSVSVLIQISYHLYQGLAPTLFLLPYFLIVSIYFVKTGNLNPVIYSHIMIDLLNLLWRR